MYALIMISHGGVDGCIGQLASNIVDSVVGSS